MRRKQLLIAAGVATALITLGVGVLAVARPDLWQRVAGQIAGADEDEGDIHASGFIEAEEIALAPAQGGRVAALHADEGGKVEAGQALARLDTALVDAQIDVAQAGVALAEAELAQVEAPARPEDLAVAEADLALAEAGLQGAQQALTDAIALRDNPQRLETQITRARAALAVAETELAQATALKDAAEIGYDEYWETQEEMADAKEKLAQIPVELRPQMPTPPLEFHFVPNAYWKAWIGVNAAQARLDGARATLGELIEMRDSPQDLEAHVDAARAAVESAEANVALALAQVNGLQAGATEEEIAIASAVVEQARAALATLEDQRAQMTLKAPTGGIVLERVIHEGELAAAGSTLLIIGNLDQVDLTVYVPLDRLGAVHVGQSVEIRVDAFPGRVFQGHVVRIADEAEFTPRNVQAEEERIHMVFAVEVRIPNEDHALKPGLPADAVLLTEEGS